MRLHQILMVVRFYPSKTDMSLFVYRDHGIMLYLLVYVDYIIVTSNHPSSLESIISKLGDEFSIHDLGCLSFFLGVELTHTTSFVFINLDTLHTCYRASMQNCKPMCTHKAPNTKFHVGDSSLFDDRTLSRIIIEDLKYVKLTCHDLKFSM